MSILVPVAGKGITINEVPDRMSVYFEIGECRQNCKGCHSPHLHTQIKDKMSVADMKSYAQRMVNEGANAIVILGGTTNGIPLEDLKRIIDTLADVAPVCVYSGTDDKDINKWITFNTELNWIKTGSYKEDLGGLQSPKTNQRFYRLGIIYNYDMFGNITSCRPHIIDETYKFLPILKEV